MTPKEIGMEPESDPGAWQRGHRGRITTAPSDGSVPAAARAPWQASCSCGWLPEPHTRNGNARRALRRHLAEAQAIQGDHPDA